MAKHSFIYEFGPFLLDPGARRLVKENTLVSLAPKSFDLLHVLIENRSRAMSKSELMEALWPDAEVEEGNLAFQVSVLRKALGPEAGSCIETVPRHGYRFSVPVVIHPLAEPASAAAAESTIDEKSPSRHTFRFLTKTGVGIVALAVTGALVSLSRKPTPPMPLRTLPLTTFRGFEANPALSPDGNSVAFAWNGEKQDNLDIYVMPITSRAPVRLTTNAAEDVSPAWSPDGSTVAFLRRLSADRAELMVVPAAGGPEHKVAEIREQPWFSPRKPAAIAWCPDGRCIAASHREASDRSEGIYLFSLTGGKRRLTMPPPGFHSDRMPSFSPNGRDLAFCRLPGGFVSEIYVLALDPNLQPSGKERRLTDYKRWCAQPVWTRDGRRILHVFGNDASKGREIRSINIADPQAPAETIPINDEVSEIAFGRHLIYSRQIEDTNIWRAEIRKNGDPPVEAELFISSTWVDQTPRYSPDGKKIAFISSRSGFREVWISNADGSNAVRMTFINGPMTGHPSWSPDGHWIAFHARVEGSTDIFVVPAAGGPPKRLTTNTWEDHYPNYSRDGRSIFFSSRRSGDMQIWRMSLDGSNAVQITTSGAAHNPTESPDGTSVFYHRFQDPGEVWRIPVQGGGPVRMAGPTHRFPVGYTVTTEGLYYGAPPHDGEERFIKFLSFSTGQNKPVVSAKRPFHSGMSVSPDSRYILFDQYDDSGSDLMIVEGFGGPRR